MVLKMVLYFIVFIVFLSGTFFYVLQKSKQCENKKCVCPVKDNVRNGYLIVGILSVIALVLIILIEIYFK